MVTSPCAGRARGFHDRNAIGDLRLAGDQGASIPEYAMLFGLAAVVVLGAVQLLSGVFVDVLDQSLNGVQTGEVTEGAPGGGGGGGPTTTLAGGGPSTTIAPTTTTTVPSTTTTTRCRRRC